MQAIPENYQALKQGRPRGNGSNAPTVNARELHGFLGNGKQFSNWIQDRITKYGFVQEVDYTTAKSKSLAGQTRIEYHVSIGMAKELAMVERNDQGKQARLYFIECVT